MAIACVECICAVLHKFTTFKIWCSCNLLLSMMKTSFGEPAAILDARDLRSIPGCRQQARAVHAPWSYVSRRSRGTCCPVSEFLPWQFQCKVPIVDEYSTTYWMSVTGFDWSSRQLECQPPLHYRHSTRPSSCHRKLCASNGLAGRKTTYQRRRRYCRRPVDNGEFYGQLILGSSMRSGRLDACRPGQLPDQRWRAQLAAAVQRTRDIQPSSPHRRGERVRTIDVQYSRDRAGR